MFLSRILLLLAVISPVAGGAQSLDELPLEFTRGQAISLACSSCHGTDGISFGSVPSLRGRPAAELEEMLLTFRETEDLGAIMSRIAKGFSEEELTMVSDYFGSMK